MFAQCMFQTGTLFSITILSSISNTTSTVMIEVVHNVLKKQSFLAVSQYAIN